MAVIYRMVYQEQDHIRHLYAGFLSEDSLMGFIEADGLIDDHSLAVMLPESEPERVSTQGRKRVFIPLHAIVRIDELVEQQNSKPQGEQVVQAFPRRQTSPTTETASE